MSATENINPINIGRFSMIPEHIARTPGITCREFRLWAEMASLSSPGTPQVWLSQKMMAEKLDCATRTLRKSIKALLEAGLIKFNGQWKWGRYKYYELRWEALEKAEKRQETSGSNREVILPRRITRATHPGPQRPNKNICIEHSSNKEQQQCDGSELEKEMSSFGIAKHVVVSLIQKFGKEECAKQIFHFKNLAIKPKNIAAWLVSAIKEQYALPAEMKTTDKTKEEEKAKTERREARLSLIAKGKHELETGCPLKARAILFEAEKIGLSQESGILIMNANEKIKRIEEQKAAREFEKQLSENQRLGLWDKARAQAQNQRHFSEDMVSEKYVNLLIELQNQGGQNASY